MKKLIFSILGLAVLAGGVFIGVGLIRKSQELRTSAAPSTTLSISPESQSVSPGRTFTQNVVMNTGTNRVIGVQFEIRFNPQAIEITGIQRGAGLAALSQEIKKSTDNTTGSISYVAYTINSDNAVSGDGISALTINGKVKDTAAYGLYQTSFDPVTAISASGEGQNVVSGATSGTVSVYRKGDVNADAKVDIVDIGIIIDHFGSSPPGDPRADLSGDNAVNIVDIGIVIDNLD